MSPLKLQLLIDASRIRMKRDKVSAEEAVARYQTLLTEEEMAAMLAALK